jgi:hypothetical protein
MNAATFCKRTVNVISAWGLLYLLTVPGLADGAEDSLEVLPRWTKGEKARYEIIKTRRTAQGKSITRKTTTRTALEIEVLSANDDGYVLAWTLGATRFDDPKQAKDPLIRRMGNLLKHKRIILELDSQAAIIGVQNWRELKESSAKMLDVLTEELNAAELDQGTIAKMRSQVASMFATKQQVEQLCTREAQMFFMPLGIELAPSEPFEYEDRLPNAFGGEPFPSRAQFALKAVDRATGRANITWTQTIPPDDARRIMEETLRNLARRLGKPVPDEEQLKNLVIADTAEFVLEVSTGWIYSLTHERSTKTEGTSQEDVVTITRKTQ